MLSKRSIVVIYFILVISSVYCAWKAGAITTIEGWLALATLWVFVGGVVFNYFSFLIEDKKQKLTHSENLVKEVFEKNVFNGNIGYDTDEISKSYVQWNCDEDWLHCAKQHLDNKEYSTIYQAYINGQEYAKTKIDETNIKIQHYRNLIEQKLKNAKIPLASLKELSYSEKDEYSQREIKHLIYYDILSELENREKKCLKIESIDFISSCRSLKGSFYLEWGDPTRIVAIGELASLEYLKNIIKQIETDKEIIQEILEIEALKIQLKNNTELEHFNHDREKIVIQVKKSGKPIKGKCGGCP